MNLESSNTLTVKYAIPGFLLVLLLVIICERFVDLPVAWFFSHYFLESDTPLAEYASDIPDLLFLIVLGVTIASWAAYFYLRRGNVDNSRMRFLRLVGTVAPTSFALKSILKFGFGRINTRAWLEHPDLYGFHWLNGGSHFEGFPSGHMMVFTALALTAWRFYPRYRTLYLVGLAILAAALIVTDYHFVSDVIAGAYLGLLAEMLVYRAMFSNMAACHSRDAAAE